MNTFDDGLTVLLTFEMDDRDEQRAFLDAYAPVVEQYVSDSNGFAGATLHVSTDGTRVVNETRWASRTAYDEFLARPDAEARLAAIGRALGAIPGLRGPRWDRTHTFVPGRRIDPGASG